MYLSRAHTGNIFPSWTVVVWRHHVYVREFHGPSCNSVEIKVFLKDPDPYLRLTDPDPDPGGPKTRGSGGSGSATLLTA
jgi:hypothetical protein